jgi:hypothetical protein
MRVLIELLVVGFDETDLQLVVQADNIIKHCPTTLCRFFCQHCDP